MHAKFLRIVIAGIFFANVSVCAAQSSTENNVQSEIRIYVPKAGSLFVQSTPAPKLSTEYVKIDFCTPHQRLQANQLSDADDVSLPPPKIALVSHQEPAEDGSLTKKDKDQKSKTVPLKSDWHPVAGQTIGRHVLDRLRESIRSARARLPKDDAENEKSEVFQVLARAEQWHAKGLEKQKKIDQLQKQIQDAPSEIKDLEGQLTEALPAPIESLEPALSIDHYLNELQNKRQVLQEWRVELHDADDNLKQRSKLVAELIPRRERATQELGKASESIAATNEKEGLDSESTRLENQAIAIVNAIELQLLDVESEWFLATEKHAPLKRDVLKRRVDHTSQTVQALEKLVDGQRAALAKAEAEKAKQEAANAHPLVRDLAEENAGLAAEINRVAKKIADDSLEQQQLQQQLEALHPVKSKLEQHVELAGHSRAVGLMLRNHRAQLPEINQNIRRLDEIKSVLPELTLKQLEFQEKRELLVEKQDQFQREFEYLEPLQRDNLLAMSSQLINGQRDYLDRLNSDYGKFLTGLSNLQLAHQQMIEKTNELRLFIDQHVLWIRSAEPIDSSDFRDAITGIQSIASSSGWGDTLGWLNTRLTLNWPVLLLITFALWLAIGMRKQLNRRLRSICRRRSEYRMLPIIRSTLLTILQASFFPVLVATAGWLFQAPYDNGSLKNALSIGFLKLAPHLLIASVLFRFLIREGVAEAQLNWSKQLTAKMRRLIGSIVQYCLPLLWATYVLESFKDGRWSDSLGRMTFVLAMLMLSFALLRGLRGVRRTWKYELNNPPTAIWFQTFGVWSTLLILSPIVLVFFAGLGYLYSSILVGTKLIMSCWLVAGSVAVTGIARRMIDVGHNILVARRRVRFANADVLEDAQRGSVDELKEMDAVRNQVQRLLLVASIAVCIITATSLWSEALPALQVFDQGVWQINKQIETTGPDKSTIVKEQLSWITVGDILRCFLILVATIILSRNLPGLLEMVVLNRLPFDRGGRYAISIVIRYLVAAIGLVVVFRTIGFTWGSVQWLLAAMSVGLGFGLQEIFANFVSGIIILLERPVRVGDLVTVNGTTGFVTKMQLRATTIMDYDRRELIVPNKKFITDDVINWTLTDSITRVVVPVGIAYGSDTQKAQKVLLQIAQRHPLVLDQPESSVVFASFGSSTLDFELRVHIPDRENYPEVVHQLHMAVDDEFRKAGIEIAFPQQDIHVRSIEPIVHSIAEINQGLPMVAETRKKAA